MKSIRYVSLILVFCMGLLGSCSDHGNTPLSGRLVHHTNCKSFVKSDSAFPMGKGISCAEYAFDKEQALLRIKHINAGFNCCPRHLNCSVILDGRTIIITESEDSAPCDCSCLYDLSIEVTGISPLAYHVIFKEPYLGEQDPLEFDMDLSTMPTGKYCVARDAYPWR